MKEKKSIKLISPSSFYYWEKCPLRAVFSNENNKIQIFPKHPDSDLGTIIHQFYENKEKWQIKSGKRFETKWAELIDIVDTAYKNNPIQRIYFPLKWHSKFFAVKKQLLKNNLLAIKPVFEADTGTSIAFEKWIDDKVNVGGYVDLIVFDKQEKIIEIIDFKTGNIFENINKRQQIKESYFSQLALYLKVISLSQPFLPKAYIQDITGKKHLLKIDEDEATAIYDRAIKLKVYINNNIENETLNNLAVSNHSNCSNCDYRPFCETHKKVLVNNFDFQNIDILGTITNIKSPHLPKTDIEVNINNVNYVVKEIAINKPLIKGAIVYIYNLFSKDIPSKILYSSPKTIIIPAEAL